MKSLEQLLGGSRDPRLAKQPVWVQELVHQLASRMEQEVVYAQVTQARTDREAEAARALLNEGPPGSDTFLDLTDAIRSNYSDDGRDDQRPLGTGVTVEFRDPADSPGEGYSVKFKDSCLEIDGASALSVIPVHSSSVRIGRV